MILRRRDDRVSAVEFASHAGMDMAVAHATEEATSQEWALALLLSVPPSDRALSGWLYAGTGGNLLRMLAGPR